jgi:hypothetical protein
MVMAMSSNAAADTRRSSLVQLSNVNQLLDRPGSSFLPSFYDIIADNI